MKWRPGSARSSRGATVLITAYYTTRGVVLLTERLARVYIPPGNWVKNGRDAQCEKVVGRGKRDRVIDSAKRRKH